MTDSAQFDRNTLAAVKPGMDGSLAQISEQLELYLGAPADNGAALESVRSELHRLLGVLKMVGLNGVAVFCAELEAAKAEYKAAVARGLTPSRNCEEEAEALAIR